MTSILAVDDSASMRQMVSFTLKGAGFDVREATDGVEALEIAKTESFDLVLTDVNMPNMNGIEFLFALGAVTLMTSVHVLWTYFVYRLDNPKEELKPDLDEQMERI